MTGGRISRSKAAELIEPAPIFVLVDPQMGENIGATARAMLNFGVSGLRIVRPRDGWPNPKAAATASGASLVIDRAQVFDSVDDALAGCHFVAATTARRRELNLPVTTPADLAAGMRRRIAAGETCAVMFGGERNGLETDDVARADAIVSIPVNPAFASLNLSQAALIVAYEWLRAGDVEIDNPMAEQTPATREAVSRLYDRLEAALDDKDYFFPPEMRQHMARTLRTALTRAGFTDGEVRTLHGVIKTLARKNHDL